VSVERAVGVLCRGEAVLLVRRQDDRLLDGTWEFPGLEVPAGGEAEPALRRYLRELFGRPVRVKAELGQVKHSITHRRLLVRGYEVRVTDPPRAHRDRRRWILPGDLAELPVSSMTTKLLKTIRAG
jgi:adenine-specific DNA glycosylase